MLFFSALTVVDVSLFVNSFDSVNEATMVSVVGRNNFPFWPF